MFKIKFRIFTFCLGIAWCAFFTGLVVSDIGKTMPGSTLNWWDAIWIPFVAAIFPFLLGLLSFISFERIKF